MTTDLREKPRIVVVGAGFGGLTFCQALPCRVAEITVVDRQNHHLFQPLLYQVATAGSSAPEIAQPVRSILRKKRNGTVLLREVTGFDLARHEVRLGNEVQANIRLYNAGRYQREAMNRPLAAHPSMGDPCSINVRWIFGDIARPFDKRMAVRVLNLEMGWKMRRMVA